MGTKKLSHLLLVKHTFYCCKHWVGEIGISRFSLLADKSAMTWLACIENFKSGKKLKKEMLIFSHLAVTFSD
jgi:hypothetical protein